MPEASPTRGYSGGPGSPGNLGVTPEKRARSARIFFLLRGLLTVVTVAAVAVYAWRGREYLRGGWTWDWKWAVAGVLLAPALILGRAGKWLLLARPLDASVTYPQALKSFVGALPLAVVSPGRVGEFARCLYLPQKVFHGMAGAGRVFLDNWADMTGAVVWVCLGWMSYMSWIGIGEAWSLRLIPAALLAVLLPVRLWMRAARRVVAALPRLWGLREALGRAVPRPEQLAAGNFAAALLVCVGVWGLEWAQAGCLLRFLGNQPPGFITLGGLLALVAMANALQVTLAGLGVREGLAAYLLSRAGIDFRAALVAAFCQTLCNQMLPAMAGLLIKPAVWPARGPAAEGGVVDGSPGA